MDSNNIGLKIVGYILMCLGIIPMILYIKFHNINKN